MRIGLVTALVAVSLGLVATTVPVQAANWLEARGRSCDEVCGKGGSPAISSGEHRPSGQPTGQNYYVCSAEMNGWRSGYNLRPNWSNACMVGYGGKEVRATKYLCACE